MTKDETSILTVNMVAAPTNYFLLTNLRKKRRPPHRFLLQNVNYNELENCFVRLQNDQLYEVQNDHLSRETIQELCGPVIHVDKTT